MYVTLRLPYVDKRGWGATCARSRRILDTVENALRIGRRTRCPLLWVVVGEDANVQLTSNVGERTGEWVREGPGQTRGRRCQNEMVLEMCDRWLLRAPNTFETEHAPPWADASLGLGRTGGQHVGAK